MANKAICTTLDVIILPLPVFFSVFLSYGDKGFCYLNLAGITKLKYDRKNEWIRVVISKSDTIRILPINKHIITLPVFPYRPLEKYSKF